MQADEGCYFCGPVKNCAPYLDTIFNNILHIANKVFAGKFKIIIAADPSTDLSINILKQWQSTLGADKMALHINTPAQQLSYRTHNIAKARNTCLQYVLNEHKYDLMIMMDFDNVNTSTPIEANLIKYLAPQWRNQWDALSFNTAPFYYDIWALSIWPYCFSYNHFKDSVRFYDVIKQYVGGLLDKTRETDELLQCISAFNGFAIYKLDKVVDCIYDGHINTHLIPEHMMKAHKDATKSVELQFPVFPTVNCQHEDCEHRAFHVQMFVKNKAKIRIAPVCMFTFIGKEKN